MNFTSHFSSRMEIWRSLSILFSILIGNFALTPNAESFCRKHKRLTESKAQKDLSGKGDWRDSLNQSKVSGLASTLSPKGLTPWNDNSLAPGHLALIHLEPIFIVQAIRNACSARRGQFSRWWDAALNVLKSSGPLDISANFKSRNAAPSCRLTPISACCPSFVKSLSVPTSLSGSRASYHTIVLPKFDFRTAYSTLQSANVTCFPLILRRRMTEAATSSVRYASNILTHSDSGTTIKLSTTGYERENITVEVEQGWLVIEALATAPAEGGGYIQRHMMRRYQLPPYADLQNVKVELNETTKELKVTVPNMKFNS